MRTFVDECVACRINGDRTAFRGKQFSFSSAACHLDYATEVAADVHHARCADRDISEWLSGVGPSFDMDFPDLYARRVELGYPFFVVELGDIDVSFRVDRHTRG